MKNSKLKSPDFEKIAAWYLSRVGKKVHRTKMECKCGECEEVFAPIENIRSVGYASGLALSIRGLKLSGCVVEYSDNP